MSRASTQTSKGTQSAAPVKSQGSQQQMGQQQMGQQGNSQTQLPREKVAMRAYQKWMERGCRHGHDQQDWMDAEAELRSEMMKGGGNSTGSQSQSRR